jgi:ribosome-associated protein
MPTPSGQRQIRVTPDVVLPKSALRFRFERSSGPGGQNVNKLATKVRLSVDLAALGEAIGPAHLRRFLAAAGSGRLTERGKLILTNDESRSQVANRDACFSLLRRLLLATRHPPKTRRPTRPTQGSQQRRVDAKTQRGQVKRLRKPPKRLDE